MLRRPLDRPALAASGTVASLLTVAVFGWALLSRERADLGALGYLSLVSAIPFDRETRRESALALLVPLAAALLNALSPLAALLFAAASLLVSLAVLRPAIRAHRAETRRTKGTL